LLKRIIHKGKILFSSEKKYLRELANMLGFMPRNLELYKQAFRHNSVATYIHVTGEKNSNERLEYLGDAILDCVVAEVLFMRYPYKNEGFLTEMRSKIVSRDQLAELGRKMGIAQFIEYDNNLKENPFVLKTITGNAMEAMIGAIYLDKGFNFTRQYIINNILLLHIDMDELQSTEFNFKSKLYEWGQRNKKTITFELREETGKSHRKQYKIAVMVDEEEIGFGINFSKKKAEQQAAERACAALKLND
jgi:ribonuclease III